jgi:hypothetical protein
LDSVILLTLIIAIPVVAGQVIQGALGRWGVVMYAPVFFLEPLLVSYWGQTIGQYLFGITVVREADQSKRRLLSSFVRYYAKACLGLYSMIYMLFSGKHKAIHDYLARTVVILSPYRLAKTPLFVERGIMEQEPEKGFVYPSALRRFGFFVIWWFITLTVLYAIVDALLSLTVGTDRAARLLKSGDLLVTFLVLILLLVVASLAAKGLLPGARRRPHTFTDLMATSTDNEDCDRTKASS